MAKPIMIDVDVTELEAVIQFHESMIEGAEESGETAEVATRQKRVKELSRIIVAYWTDYHKKKA